MIEQEQDLGIVAVPQQDEIALIDDGDFITIHQQTSNGGFDADVVVHRNNLSALILALRRIDGQEV